MRAGLVFPGFSEPAITFPPTFKYQVAARPPGSRHVHARACTCSRVHTHKHARTHTHTDTHTHTHTHTHTQLKCLATAQEWSDQYEEKKRRVPSWTDRILTRTPPGNPKQP